ncbi:MarR family winged helix-turn-helix transcriptional regulator [Pseudonocardia acaciae]|uniref:MarR family winged helix-turn-helix transcriptional regulator n=1 Tax=Pseudonocardia acaciae TaxID=551276 RepID=UPI0005602419|nr:MarR family transcriptional regulator [Pseudonocardia acaciae]
MDDRSANLVTALVVALADALDETTGRAGAHGANGASALATIHFVPGERIDELSRVLGITGSGTVRLVDRLVADGLVERRPGRDRRSVSLWLTERGAAVAEEIVARRREVLRRALEPLTDAQRDALAAVAEPALAGMAVNRERADRICRLCDYVACPQDRCPVERAVS